MANFQLSGEREPFLIVELRAGEKIYAESDSMLAMQDGIEITARARGGFLQSIARRVTSDENIFQQEIKAYRDSLVMLSPALPGDIKILDVNRNRGFFLNDYAFFASSDTINLETKLNQNISSSIFGGDGFFLLHANGVGKVVINALGSIEEIDMSVEGGDFIIDNGHLLAWEDTITYQAELVNQRSPNKGFFRKAFDTIVSGEMIVMRLRGNGKVYIASRNLDNFKSFINSLVQKKKKE